MYGQKKVENIMYLVLWALLFAAPAFSLYLRTLNDTTITFQWSEILEAWKILLPFFVAFVIHNLLLAPILVYSNKKLLYFVASAALLILFQVFQCDFQPHRDDMAMRELLESEPPPLPGEEGFVGPFEAQGDSIATNRRMERNVPQGDMNERAMNERGMNERGKAGGRMREGGMRDAGMNDGQQKPEPPDLAKFKNRDDFKYKKKPPLLLGQQDVVAFIIIIMMLGLNLGVKHYFFTVEARKRMREREKHSLQQQLEYLKYQINPHFFMNTLNNIHALVDIDPEQAKTTIEELSKMMRYVLYDGAKPEAPLAKEVDFIKRYISLMRIRYTDRVKIHVNLPDVVPDCTVPPLIYITFIENAFKHGVSYEQQSYIEVVLTVGEDRVSFSCRNSRKSPEKDTHGGVGLTNTRQRLDLIYGNKYTLDIQESDKMYSVDLDIPRQSQAKATDKPENKQAGEQKNNVEPNTNI